MAHIIVILGAPGTGKGTQARALAQTTGCPLISVSRLQEDLAWSATLLGHAATTRPESLTDEDLMQSIETRTSQPDCDDGYILDGWPNTLRQARMLEELAMRQGHDILVYRLSATPAALMKRLNGRRVCQHCGESYNTWLRPPVAQGRCDLCGLPLGSRDYESEAMLQSRLSGWQQSAEPVTNYFRQSGRLVEINAERPAEEVFYDLCSSATGLTCGA